MRGIQEAKEICEMWENMRRVNLARTKERERAAIDEQTNLESYSDRILMIDEMSCTLQKYFRVSYSAEKKQIFKSIRSKMSEVTRRRRLKSAPRQRHQNC